jgi:dipicolinate synthase subunit A
VPIFGGRFSESFRLSASARKKRVIDYFESETLQIKNATPTAEGAIYLAMQNMQKTLCGSRVAVVGYGRIGKMLSHLLEKMGASVTVAARNLRQLAEASSFGNDILRISSSYALGGLGPLCNEGEYDAIFNTVPARLFDKEVIEMLPKDVLLIDLASVPGGVDFAAAKERGINAIWALSLPGKYAPETAGNIIADTLDELFEIMTLKQLARHKKPIAILNINGYYNGLKSMLENAVEGGFMLKESLALAPFFENVEDLLEYLESYKPIDAGVLKNLGNK